MAKVTIDGSLCTGCGLCAANCPQVFKVGDDNLAHVITGGSSACDLKEITQQCPVSAILLKG